ncbi:MAG: hypothetical protein P9L91_05195, partial [Candidatus Zophobacter franzmannii]|nr:hypothetical protein [Candidatus Zophobacter franzmannii]
MAQAYSAGLTVTSSIVLRKERILPIKGKVLVKVGDKVKAEDLVAETMLPGNVIPIKLANKMGCTPQQLVDFLKVEPGAMITEGQVLAENKGFLGTGLWKNSFKSPTDGEIESVSKHTGQMLLREPRIPIQVKAFVAGVITEVIPDQGVVIENKSAYIQGIFGLGGETFGEIKVIAKDPADTLEANMIDESCKGKIIVGGSLVSYAAIKKAMEVDVAAIITGGIEDHDIKELLGYDIGVAITGHEDINTTIIVTEGFGNINMAHKTFELLKSFDGQKASCHGMTQIRAGVMRPEVIIPIKFDENDLKVAKPKMPTLE